MSIAEVSIKSCQINIVSRSRPACLIKCVRKILQKNCTNTAKILPPAAGISLITGKRSEALEFIIAEKWHLEKAERAEGSVLHKKLDS